MIYLSQFIFPSIQAEESFLHKIKETCYTTVYPFQILPEHDIRVFNFDDPITILYGGNGSGKTTVLNVIAEKLSLKRDTLYNRTNFFENFTGFCEYVPERELPENSLSPERQQELVQFIEDSIRFFGCQFVIATHSPFLLSMQNAKIYNLDEEPMRVCHWTDLPNIRAYYNFFKQHEDEF